MPRVYCARCGRPNPDGARFCSYCGTQLTAPVPPGSGMPAGSGLPAAPGGTGGYPAGAPPERPGETTSTISLGRTDDDLGEDLYPDSASFGALPPGSALLLVIRGPNAGSRFRLENAEFQVVDVGSLNGTYVNREPVDSAVLANGDDIRIGNFRLIFVAGPPGAERL